MISKLINKFFRKKETLTLSEEFFKDWEESDRLDRQKLRQLDEAECVDVPDEERNKK